jgi:HSP20 family protein
MFSKLKMEKLETKPNKPTRHNATRSTTTAGIVSWQLTIRPQIWKPPTDVYETDERFVVRVEIAGMKESDFIVRLDLNHLVISGIRPDNLEPRAYHLMEINFGEFSTEVELLAPIDSSKVEAEYKDGFLTVILSKTQPKQISINP